MTCMHIWEGQAFSEVALIPVRRDPARFKISCTVTDGKENTFQLWFYNIPETSQWLRRMEPQRWGFNGPELIEIKTALEPALTQVDVYGLTDANRKTHNAVTRPCYWITHWVLG